MLRFRDECGASSVMIARACEWNCSIFRRPKPSPSPGNNHGTVPGEQQDGDHHRRTAQDLPGQSGTRTVEQISPPPPPIQTDCENLENTAIRQMQNDDEHATITTQDDNKEITKRTQNGAWSIQNGGDNDHQTKTMTTRVRTTVEENKPKNPGHIRCGVAPTSNRNDTAQIAQTITDISSAQDHNNSSSNGNGNSDVDGNDDGGLLPMDDVIRRYLVLSVDYDNSPSNTKYCVQNMLRELQESERGKRFLECQTLEQICSIWNLDGYCRSKQTEFKRLGLQNRWHVDPSQLSTSTSSTDDVTTEPPCSKRLKTTTDNNQHSVELCDNIDNEEDGTSVISMRVAFLRANFPVDTELPKSKLHTWAQRKDKTLPSYEMIRSDKLFRAMMRYEGKRYTSTYWEKNKRFAEQGAALVCLCSLGLVDQQTLLDNGSML